MKASPLVLYFRELEVLAEVFPGGRKWCAWPRAQHMQRPRVRETETEYSTNIVHSQDREREEEAVLVPGH